MTEWNEDDDAALGGALEDDEQGGAAFRDFVLERLNSLLAAVEEHGREIAAVRAEISG